MLETSIDQLLRELIQSDENHCFVCSPHNPTGLHLQFRQEDGVIRTEFVPGTWHEGWQGVVHGGILAAVLDEAMAYALFFRGVKGVTAKMEVRYRAPIHKSDTLQVEARMIRNTRRLAELHGLIRRDGEPVVEAEGIFVKLGPLDRQTVG